MRLRPANIRLINRRLNLPRLLLALSSTNGKSNDNDKNKISPTDTQGLTGHSISDGKHHRMFGTTVNGGTEAGECNTGTEGVEIGRAHV